MQVRGWKDGLGHEGHSGGGKFLPRPQHNSIHGFPSIFHRLWCLVRAMLKCLKRCRGLDRCTGMDQTLSTTVARARDISTGTGTVLCLCPSGSGKKPVAALSWGRQLALKSTPGRWRTRAFAPVGALPDGGRYLPPPLHPVNTQPHHPHSLITPAHAEIGTETSGR